MTCSDLESASNYTVPELRAAVFGERTEGLTAEMALGLLVKKEHAELAEDLERAVRSEKVDARARHHAAVLLARAVGARAEPALTDSLRDRDPFVKRGVLRALGLVGRARALDDIREVGRGEKVVAEAARRAAELVAYRTGADGVKFSEIDPAKIDARDLRKITFERIEADAARELVDDLRQDASWAELGGEVRVDAALGIDCLGERHTLLPFSEGLEPRRALSAPAILAVVASCAHVEGERWYQRYLVVAHPERGKGAACRLLSAAGRVHATGQLVPEGDRARFDLRSVGRPGAWPLIVEGSVGPEGVEIRRALSSVRPVRRVLEGSANRD